MGKYIICTNCNGSGKVIDKEQALFTLGLSLIFKFQKNDGKINCPICNGNKKIKLS